MTSKSGFNTRTTNVPSFSPTKIALFRQCPERYLRRYHVGPRHREETTRPLARGKAVHGLMATYAQRRGTNWQPTRNDITTALGGAGFPAEERDTFFDEDADETQRLVEWGIEEFERRYGAATILAVEEFLAYTHGENGVLSYRLEAKVDLVVLHPDGTLEHVDYKTGRFELDETQNLICRVVTGSNANKLTGDRHFVGPEGVRTSVMFLADRQTVTRIIPRDEIRVSWVTLQETVAAIMAGTGKLKVGVTPWVPQPNGLCAYCPFDSICSRNTISHGDTAMLDWLSASGITA